MNADKLLCYLLIAVWTLTGCSDSEQVLDRGYVENIPAGNATGAAYGGVYSVTLKLLSCSCPDITHIGVTSNPCDIIHEGGSTARATQNDGHLIVEIPNLQPNVLHGGIDQDGSFEAGGAANITIVGTGGEIYVVVKGTIDQSQKLDARSRFRLVVPSSEDPVDCDGDQSISGSKQN